jgi:DNA-binding NtrC family response regulator
MERLLRHSWPGNVRELRNVVERITLLVGDSTITGRHIRALSHRRSPAPHHEDAFPFEGDAYVFVAPGAGRGDHDDAHVVRTAFDEHLVPSALATPTRRRRDLPGRMGVEGLARGLLDRERGEAARFESEDDVAGCVA